MKQYEEIVRILKDNRESVSFMESCTGGFLSSVLTNVEGASSVFSFGAVTYSNDAKIKFGVSKEVIDTYTVYSMETAKEMARAIASYANSTYGIGITGKLGVSDPANPYGKDNMVYISVYDSVHDMYKEQTMTMELEDRLLQKEKIAMCIGIVFLQFLKK